MVEHHHRVGDGAGELEQFDVLVVIVPGVVGEAAAAEFGDPGAERRVEPAIGGRPAGDRERLGFERSRQRVADAPETAPGGLLVGVEHLAQSVAERQVGVGDDAGDRGGVRVPGGQFVGLGGDELGLADRAEVVGAIGTVGGAAFHEHRRHDVVAVGGVGHEVVDRIGDAAARRPEVVVGVDDRYVGVDDRLDHLVVPLRGAGGEHQPSVTKPPRVPLKKSRGSGPSPLWSASSATTRPSTK